MNEDEIIRTIDLKNMGFDELEILSLALSEYNAKLISIDGASVSNLLGNYTDSHKSIVESLRDQIDCALYKLYQLPIGRKEANYGNVSRKSKSS